MRIISGLAIVATMSACASTQTVLDKEPTEVFHSAKTPNEIAFCMANKNHTPAMDRDDGSKVLLIKNGYGGVSMAFSIYPEGTGSRVEYRKQFGTIGGIWKQCIGLKEEK
jgi:galactose-1-phosphate uridylyltransferase